MFWLKRCTFLLVAVDPHVKSLSVLLIVPMILDEIVRHCMRWVGMAERTNLASVPLLREKSWSTPMKRKHLITWLQQREKHHQQIGYEKFVV